ncbi:pantothenate transporter [Aspergillus eucalypticola CBS 122712]|uniref:Pantothenate transporter n=1 Tax=Aspergillus eucalypticola (strain CBS 122712 / IBT 29274) TaxID=1448314 RepID=A0A317VZK1_ASPEC|nr:pantothenate transporter [Aspergillus eucalypticola CBS 122712]PWY78741.1 pantothenate transporter [Aspergillus eucalypticola CBS 122712]
MADFTTEKKEECGGDHEAVKTSFDNGVIELESMPRFSVEAEKRLVRKIDFRILPIMLVAYMMSFVDKQTLNYSAIMGLLTDLKLHGTEYSWTSSIFYFGYLAFSYPASLLLVKFPLGKYLACTYYSLCWAVVLACHAATTNFTGLMVARFFLGCAEASVTPGFSLLTSLWYRASEQPLRHGIWFCGNSLSLVLGNAIAVGIWQIQDSLASWKWMFIIFGIVTFLWGFVMLLRLPDSPTNASFLTDEERVIALARLKANKAGYKNNKIEWGQVLEAFTDPKTWFLAVFVLGCNIPNGGYTTFSGLILQGFGYDTEHTLLLGMPGGFIVFLIVLISCFTSTKLANSRCITSIIVTCVSILGTALVYSTKPIASRYIGLILMSLYSVSLPLSMAMISASIGGITKRATVSAIYFIMYCAGNIIGPQLFFESQAPRYQSGFIAVFVCLAVVVVDLVAFVVYLRWENARRDRLGMGMGMGMGMGIGEGEEREVLADVTDLKNPGFRYVY